MESAAVQFDVAVRPVVTGEDLAVFLNRLPVAAWGDPGFRVNGRWLEIDPEASDRLAARNLRVSLEEARQRNQEEARWLVAGGVGVVYQEGRGWRASKRTP